MKQVIVLYYGIKLENKKRGLTPYFVFCDSVNFIFSELNWFFQTFDFLCSVFSVERK